MADNNFYPHHLSYFTRVGHRTFWYLYKQYPNNLHDCFKIDYDNKNMELYYIETNFYERCEDKLPPTS